MKRYAAIALLSCAVLFLLNVISGERKEKKRLTENIETLTSSVRKFRTDDSLNAARVGVLTLKNREFEKLRSEDAERLKRMNYKLKELSALTKAQTRTIVSLRGNVRDSIVYRDRHHTDTLRCIDVRDSWFSLSGCSDREGRFSGVMESRDSLTIVQTTKYRRFLFWRTRKVKSRHIDIISSNPHTKIDGFSFVEIRK